MSDQNKQGEFLSNSMVGMGALVGVCLAIGGALWLWPQLDGVDQRWKIVIIAFAAVGTVGLSILVWAITGGIIDAMIGALARRKGK